MIRDYLRFAYKDVIGTKSNIFITVSIIISTLFISELLGFGNNVHNMFTETLLLNPSVYQISILDQVSETKMQEIYEATEPKEMRVCYSIRLTGIKIDDYLIDLSETVVSVYDDNHSFFTENEIIAFQQFIDFLPSLSESRVMVTNTLLTNTAKYIEIEYLNDDMTKKLYSGEVINIPTEVNGYLPDSFVADIYIPVSLLDNVSQIRSMMFEYYEEDLENAHSFLTSNFEETTSNISHLNEIKAESSIYSTMLILLGSIILTAMFISTFSCCNIMYRERTSYFGILRILGLSKGSVYLLCIIQGIIVTFIGTLLGFVLLVGCNGILQALLSSSAQSSLVLSNMTVNFNASVMPMVMLINLMTSILSYVLSITRLLRVTMVEAISVKE